MNVRNFKVSSRDGSLVHSSNSAWLPLQDGRPIQGFVAECCDQIVGVAVLRAEEVRALTKFCRKSFLREYFHGKVECVKNVVTRRKKPFEVVPLLRLCCILEFFGVFV